MGYALLKGNCLTIYIHNKEADPKNNPLAANCQLVNTSVQNCRVQVKAGIRFIAYFKNTWPPVSSMLCKIAYGINFHMIKQLLKNEYLVNCYSLIVPLIAYKLEKFHHGSLQAPFYTSHFSKVVLHLA